MSLFRATLRSARPAVRSFSRHAASNPVTDLILKNNFSYVTAIIGTAIAVEFIYGKATYQIFSALNQGKLYEHVDWSQFEESDDDDDEWNFGWNAREWQQGIRRCLSKVHSGLHEARGIMFCHSGISGQECMKLQKTT